jgi:hypothetical protein
VKYRTAIKALFFILICVKLDSFLHGHIHNYFLLTNFKDQKQMKILSLQPQLWLTMLKVPLAIYLTKNKNTILLIIKPFKLVKTFKKRNKIGLSARITI